MVVGVPPVAPGTAAVLDGAVAAEVGVPEVVGRSGNGRSSTRGGGVVGVLGCWAPATGAASAAAGGNRVIGGVGVVVDPAVAGA